MWARIATQRSTVSRGKERNEELMGRANHRKERTNVILGDAGSNNHADPRYSRKEREGREMRVRITTQIPKSQPVRRGGKLGVGVQGTPNQKGAKGERRGKYGFE